MVVTPEMVEMVSPYTIGTASGDHATQAQFAQYSTWAADTLDDADPGLTTSKYDEAHANLIADYIWKKDGKADLTREEIGDYEYQRKGTVGPYRLAYDAILADYDNTLTASLASAGVTREDATETADMNLDQGGVPTF
ncbi:MAG: hypothetical protein KAJ03_01720 [Gammaproteobacteria bacterium]|nr:hypothetical protein [Gammaproteobacteria bacterium]